MFQGHGKKNNHDQTSSKAIMVATHSIVTEATKCCAGKLPRGDVDNLTEIVQKEQWSSQSTDQSVLASCKDIERGVRQLSVKVKTCNT